MRALLVLALLLAPAQAEPKHFRVAEAAVLQWRTQDEPDGWSLGVNSRGDSAADTDWTVPARLPYSVRTIRYVNWFYDDLGLPVTIDRPVTGSVRNLEMTCEPKLNPLRTVLALAGATLMASFLGLMVSKRRPGQRRA